MPFLRVLRDKRGYETTYLVHWYRDGNHQRSRILYAFRTPPGVRVGRDALDPAVVQEIEAQHPDISFDWRALVDNRQVIENAPEPRRDRPSKRQGRPERVEAHKRRRDRDDTEEVGTAEVGTAEVAATPPAPRPGAAPRPQQTPSRPSVPAAIEGETRDAQLAFLVRWYPELRDRIPHRTKDPIRREALLALVERLNSTSWDTEEQIAAGLQAATEALHRLSRVFSKRRRRARRPKASGPETPAANEPA